MLLHHLNILRLRVTKRTLHDIFKHEFINETVIYHSKINTVGYLKVIREIYSVMRLLKPKQLYKSNI